MKAALFCTSRYMGAAPEGWPVPANEYSAEVAERSMQTTLEQFALADQVGFDWVSVAEHHFAPFSLNPNPMVMAGALTQVVKNAKIALLGPDIPILNPLRVAEEFAMLDTLTGGRVIAGLMRGTPNEYVTYNINPTESRGRFAEALEIIRMAWTEKQPFGWQGRYYQYRSISIWPRPVQDPHPPIYMSASSPESGDYAAKNKLGIGFAFTTLPRAVTAADYWRKKSREHGWEPEPETVIYRLGVHVAATDAEARDDLAAGMQQRRVGLSMANAAVEKAVDEAGYYGRDRDEQRGRLLSRGQLEERIENGQILVGSPDTVVKQIERIKKELNAGVLDLTLAAQLGDKTMRSIELLGTQVLPRMHAM
jgi:alkanesulfonate monooxygenase SsuD/methylene tetrahydromethanopterin reductase-like flavin-dependent oxidoreductase (luciferase family)